MHLHVNPAREVLKNTSYNSPVNIKAWKKNGEIFEWKGVFCTTHYTRKDTFNMKSKTSNQIRTLRMIQIFSINDLEIYL